MEHRTNPRTRRGYVKTTEASAKTLKIGVFRGSNQNSLALRFWRRNADFLYTGLYILFTLKGHDRALCRPHELPDRMCIIVEIIADICKSSFLDPILARKSRFLSDGFNGNGRCYEAHTYSPFFCTRNGLFIIIELLWSNISGQLSLIRSGAIICPGSM